MSTTNTRYNTTSPTAPSVVEARASEGASAGARARAGARASESQAQSASLAQSAAEALLAEYEELLVKRDEYLKWAGSYRVSYTREFGELITANFELKIACIREKKKINYCRRRMNRGLAVDASRMLSEIEEEMLLYYTQLRDLERETKAAKEAKNVDEFRLSRSKKIYRRLAKQLHPDINKKTQSSEVLMDLWERVANAYCRSDVEALEVLEVLVRKALTELGEKAFSVEVRDLESRIERVERQINEILTTEPYTYGELLADEERKAGVRRELQTEHEDFEQYLAELRRALAEILAEGGFAAAEEPF